MASVLDTSDDIPEDVATSSAVLADSADLDSCDDTIFEDDAVTDVMDDSLRDDEAATAVCDVMDEAATAVDEDEAACMAVDDDA